MQRDNPPFRADHVGSLLRPAELKKARERHAKNEISDADLSRPLDAADVTAIKDAFAKYSVLIFPEQHLSQDQHLDFARRKGRRFPVERNQPYSSGNFE